MWVTEALRSVRGLEGRNVSVALTDGTRIDDCQLVSTGRGRTATLWLYSGQDIFVSHDQVIDVWESPPVAFRAT
jgi:hypothetical protein